MERKQVFTGIRKEAIDFLIGLRLNNNETYYKDHLDIYEKELRAPLRELNEAVTPVIHTLDPELDTRPVSVIARLRRDTRFTRDKSPFRDHVWMGWRYPGERRSEGFHMYWGFGPDWMGWGCGSYGTDRPLMDAFRQRILTAPDQVREVFQAEGFPKRYVIGGEEYRKMKVPESVPEDLRPLYTLKYLSVSHDATEAEWALMRTPEFVRQMVAEINAMTPLLRLMKELRRGGEPVTPMDAPKPEVPLAEERTGKIVVRSAEEFEF